MDALITCSDLMLGFFFSCLFDSKLQKDLGIYDMLSEENSCTFGSIIR